MMKTTIKAFIVEKISTSETCKVYRVKKVILFQQVKSSKKNNYANYKDANLSEYIYKIAINKPTIYSTTKKKKQITFSIHRVSEMEYGQTWKNLDFLSTNTRSQITRSSLKSGYKKRQ